MCRGGPWHLGIFKFPASSKYSYSHFQKTSTGPTDRTEQNIPQSSHCLTDMFNRYRVQGRLQGRDFRARALCNDEDEWCCIDGRVTKLLNTTIKVALLHKGSENPCHKQASARTWQHVVE